MYNSYQMIKVTKKLSTLFLFQAYILSDLFISFTNILFYLFYSHLEGRIFIWKLSYKDKKISLILFNLLLLRWPL